MSARSLRLVAHACSFVLVPALAWGQCETQKLTRPGDGAAGDAFGTTVASDGTKLVTSAWLDDDNGNDSGSAYAFELVGSTWVQTGKLIASDGAATDWYGVGTDVSGSTIVVGAINDDDVGANSGSVYVFDDPGGGWVESTKLLASDGAAGDWFGFFVAVSGDTTLVGANRDDDNGASSGSAYVFDRVAGVWSETAKLVPADGAAGDEFGYSVALAGSVAVVSSPYDDDAGTDAGSVYVYELSGSSWSQTAKLVPAGLGAGDNFGVSVEVDGATVVASAWGDDDNGSNAGAAYVFEKQGASWVQTAKLLASDGAAGDNFGSGVSVSGATVVVGADKDDDLGTTSGSLYAFTKSGASWSQSTKLTACDGALGDRLGFQVFVDGSTVFAGATGDDDDGAGSGSVYVFDLAPPACGYTAYGVGLPAPNIGTLSSASQANIGTQQQIDLAGFAGAATGFLMLCRDQDSSPFKGGTRLADFSVAIKQFNPSVSAAGTGAQLFSLPNNPGLVGRSFYLQAIMPDATQVQGFALSNGLSATICP